MRITVGVAYAERAAIRGTRLANQVVDAIVVMHDADHSAAVKGKRGLVAAR